MSKPEQYAQKLIVALQIMYGINKLFSYDIETRRLQWYNHFLKIAKVKGDWCPRNELFYK